MSYVKPVVLEQGVNLSDIEITKKKRIVAELTKQIDEEESAVGFKPCPFCGRSVERVVDRGMKTDKVYELVIKHTTNCPLGSVDIVTHGYQKDILKFWWNRRTV